MVLTFQSIPLHLQRQICGMMDFPDFKQFQVSSELGSYVANMITPIVDIETFAFTMNTMTIEKDGKEVSWPEIKENKNCPRFRLQNVVYGAKLTNERCLEVLKDVEDGYFLGKNVLIYFAKTLKMDLYIFNRMLEVFNITQFHCGPVTDLLYINQPIIFKMDSVALCWSCNDEILLSLQASRIDLQSGFSIFANFNSTLNRFFKQWFTNKRNITLFELYVADTESDGFHGFGQERQKAILSDVPHTLLWSLETHTSSILSHLPLDVLTELKYFDANFSRHFYSVKSASKTLYIVFCQHFIIAREVTDPEKEILRQFAESSFILRE